MKWDENRMPEKYILQENTDKNLVKKSIIINDNLVLLYENFLNLHIYSSRINKLMFIIEN